MEVVHHRRQLRVLRLVGLAPRLPARRGDAGQSGDRRAGAPVARAARQHGRRPPLGHPRRRRQPHHARRLQVLRLLRREPQRRARRVPPRRAAPAAAHHPAGRHLVPRVPHADLRDRHLPRAARAGAGARLRRVHGVLPVPARGPHRPRPRVPPAAHLAEEPAQGGLVARLRAHPRRPRQEAAHRRLPVDAHRERALRLAADVLVVGDAVGDRRLLGADLLRLQRLRRHRHRHLAAPRVRAAGELRRAVHGADHPGLLAPLAHHPLQLAARLPVHPAGRQPQGQGPHLRQPRDHLPARRPVARGGVDVRVLGAHARHRAGRRTGAHGRASLEGTARAGPDGRREGAPAALGVRVRERGVGVLPRRVHGQRVRGAVAARSPGSGRSARR